MTTWWSAIVLGALTLLVGCNPITDNDALAGQAGDLCDRTAQCAGGLVCGAQGTCQPAGSVGSVPAGGACGQTSDCQSGLFCAVDGRCRPQRTGGVGDPCDGPEGCRGALICSRARVCAEAGEAGTALADEACSSDDACALSLFCGPAGLCAPLISATGVACPEEEGPVRILFEVPGAAGARADADTFRHPFPSDVRRIGGAVDYTAIDTPPGADLAQAYISALNQRPSGFGLNPAILFRFSAPVDFSTLTFGGDDATMVFVDVTPDAPSRGRRPSARFFATTSRSRYICSHWLGIRPGEGAPLEPERTYAVYFTEGLSTPDGDALTPDAHFEALLRPQAPGDPALLDAWQRYAPLRAWLAAEGIPTRTLVGGTVFTTGDPMSTLDALQAGLDAFEPARVEASASCEGEAPSPCADVAPRACGEPSAAFEELHLRFDLPDFQRGQPPYAETGGEISFDDEGLPRLQGRQSICAALTLPRGTPPPAGWPLVLYAHEDGGGFRSFIERGFAGALAESGFAVLSADLPLHGPRRGSDDPDVALAQRLFPVERPLVLRDLRLQAYAELRAIRRWARTPDRVADRSLTFDQARIGALGHGLGGATALLASRVGDLGAVALSATSGAMTEIILERADDQAPLAQLKAGFQDPELNGMHPAMHLLQALLDPVDPVNLPRQATHLFMLSGAGDVTTPAAATWTLALSRGLALVPPVQVPVPELEEASTSTVRGNVTREGQVLTRGLKQYPVVGFAPTAVASESEEALADLTAFFATWLTDPEGVPTLAP